MPAATRQQQQKWGEQNQKQELRQRQRQPRRTEIQAALLFYCYVDEAAQREPREGGECPVCPAGGTHLQAASHTYVVPVSPLPLRLPPLSPFPSLE